MPIHRFAPTHFFAQGDDVLKLVPMGCAINGRDIDVTLVHLWTFGNDGKATRFQHALDQHAMVAAQRREKALSANVPRRDVHHDEPCAVPNLAGAVSCTSIRRVRTRW
jgi:hypothetical protein